MTRSFRPAAVLFAAVLLIGGCRRARPAAAPEPAPPPADTAARTAFNKDSADAAAKAAADSTAAARAAAMRAAEEMRKTMMAPVYFEFDSDQLSDAARATLDSKLSILTSNPAVRIRVAGHADERGSDEYNLALGQRRAAATKRYLTERGVDEGRIEIVSFGEERPAVQGTDETAWSQNRRAEFEIVAGADQMTAPASR